jgi:CopG antitoxin of type II toxin-antitoxin system
MTKKKIPNFETLDQAVEFWETHSFVDYADDTDEITVTVNLPSKAPPVQIELTAPIARQVQDLARRRHTTPSRLVEKWVKEQLQNE